MLLFVQLEITACKPLKVTVPAAPPRFTPPAVTLVPEPPLPGIKLEMVGPIMKFTPLLCNEPAVVITTFPVVAEDGTTAVMLVSDQPEMEALCPLKLTDPALLPK